MGVSRSTSRCARSAWSDTAARTPASSRWCSGAVARRAC